MFNKKINKAIKINAFYLFTKFSILPSQKSILKKVLKLYKDKKVVKLSKIFN